MVIPVNGTIPSFLIAGAQKAGTTAAARNLSLHPGLRIFEGVTSYGQHEIEFFNQHWEDGLEWYSTHFVGDRRVEGEKTAELLHRTVCHQRMKQTNPFFKLIILLRNPVERAFSQWKMARLVKGDEPRTFEEIVESELSVINDRRYREEFYRCEPASLSSWREGYLLKGFYAEQLASLVSHFCRQQVFIAISERVRTNPKSLYAEMWQFLGLEPIEAEFEEHFVSPLGFEMKSATRELLTDLYRQPNRDLVKLLADPLTEWDTSGEK